MVLLLNFRFCYSMVWNGFVLLSRCNNHTTMPGYEIAVYMVVTMVQQLKLFCSIYYLVF